MRELRHILYCTILLANIIAVSSSDAALSEHGPPNASGILENCPRGTSNPNDGCVNANPLSAFRDENFFARAARTGGVKYVARPSWNVPYVDYPVGAFTPVANMRRSNTISNANHPGCSANPITGGGIYTVECRPTAIWFIGNTGVRGPNGTVHIATPKDGSTSAIHVGMTVDASCISCSHPKILSGSGSDWVMDGPVMQSGLPLILSGASLDISWPMDFEGIDFGDGEFRIAGSDKVGNGNPVIRFWNNALHWGAVLCTSNYGHDSMVNFGNADVDAQFNSIYLDPNCVQNANIFGTPIDPGFKTQATLTGGIVNGVLTPTNVTGRIYASSYLTFPGQTLTYQITALSSGAASCAGADCSGLAMHIGAGPCSSGPCPVDSKLNVSAGTAMAAGPMQAQTGTVFAGGFNIYYAYNAAFDLSNLGVTNSWGAIKEEFNFIRSSPAYPAHFDGFADQPATCSSECTIANSVTTGIFTHNYSVFYEPVYASAGTGTGVNAIFSTYGGANVPAPNGYQVTRPKQIDDHMVLIVNPTKNYSGNFDNVSLSPHAVTTAVIGTVGQAGPRPTASVTATITDDGNGTTSTLHISAVASGIPVVGMEVAGCAFPGCPAGVVNAQLATKGNDLSTWRVGRSYPGGRQSQLFSLYQYNGIITEADWTTNFLDCSGASTCLQHDEGTFIITHNVSGNINLITGKWP